MKIKKVFLKNFCVSLATILGISTCVVFAKQIDVVYKDMNFYLDGAKIDLSATDSDGNKIKPFICNGVTYVPISSVAKAFGKESKWDSKTNSIYFTSNNEKVSAFSFSELKFYKSDHDEIKVTCKIKNNSGKDYREPHFKISAFDDNGKLLATSTEEVDGLFKNGTTRYFNEDIDFHVDSDVNQVSNVKIEFVD